MKNNIDESEGHVLPGRRQYNRDTNAVRDVALLARRYTQIAVKRLVEIMQSSTNDMAVIKAAEVILDRGYGRAPITVDLIHNLNKVELEAAALRIIEKRRQAMALGAVDATIVPRLVAPADDASLMPKYGRNYLRTKIAIAGNVPTDTLASSVPQNREVTQAPTPAHPVVGLDGVGGQDKGPQTKVPST